MNACLRHILLLVTLILVGLIRGQDSREQTTVTYTDGVVLDGDTVPVWNLDPAKVYAPFKAKNAKERRRYSRTMRNVRRAYPYAQIASGLIKEYEYDLSQIGKEEGQRKYMKLAEAELRAEFEAEVKNLTVSQGKVLIKLIDRETGETSYQLIKQLRNGLQAFIWQGIAKMFGTDLKAEYEPKGNDYLIEQVVLRIESGQISAAPRRPITAKAKARLLKRKKRLYRKYGLVESKNG